jgi:maltose/moltooligosaccharide transporter
MSFSHIVGDFSGMPTVMKRLALAQFFSWSALFIMWIYTTPVVTQYAFGTTDVTSEIYGRGANWVGRLFAIQNGVAAIGALLILPWLAKRIGKVRTHMACLLAGSAGFASFLLIRDPNLLILSEIGLGIAWASILAMPYAILASGTACSRNLASIWGCSTSSSWCHNCWSQPLWAPYSRPIFQPNPSGTMAFAAIVMALAAVAMIRVDEPRP